MAVKFLNGIDVDGSLNLVTSDIPNLAASKITSGSFGTARIPNLAASKITSGTLGTARIPDLSATYQVAGNYFTDGDTVLNMTNNDGLVYDDATNKMYVKLDGTNREIYHTANLTPLTIGTTSTTAMAGNTSLFDGAYGSLSGTPTIPSGNAIIDWTADQGTTNIHANNYTDTNTTYTVQDGELSQNNFTNADHTKLNGIEASADVTPSWVPGTDPSYLTSIPTTLTGNRTIGGDLTVSGNNVITAGSNADVKFSVWTGTTYGIGMTAGVTYGGLNDYAMTFCMNNDSDRGFWWGYSGQTKSAGAMSLTTGGNLTLAGTASISGDISASNLSGTNTGDQDLSSYLTAETFSATDVAFTVDGNDVVAGDDLVLAGGLTWTNSTKTLTSADTNTTYTVGDGGLTENNFTNADHTKLNGIEAGATTDQDLSGYLTTTGTAADSSLLDGLDSTRFYRTVTSSSGTAGAGWVTVAKNQSGRRHGEVIVSDGDSGDHAFIRIDWMRSYGDSNFSVINVGGHQNRITGVRVLSQSSDSTYGWKYLQVYVTTSSLYGVKINSLGAPYGYSSHTAVTPVVQDTLSGYVVVGNALSGLEHATFAAEEGIVAGGVIYASGGNSSSWNTAYTHSQATHAPTDANNYVHPVTAGNKHVPTGGSAGEFLKYSASGTAVWATPSYTTNTNTQLSEAEVRASFTGGTNVSITNGVITATDTDTVYTHPTSAGNKHVPTGGSAGQFLKYSASGTATWATPSYTTNTDTNTTYSAGGGLDLTGTTFSIEPDLRDGITRIGKDSNNYIAIDADDNNTIDFFVSGVWVARMEADGDLHMKGDVVAFSDIFNP